MIIEWFDEFYSVNLSGEVIRGMTEKAMRQGYQTTPSLGYDAAGDGKPFVINEDQYKIVEFIHQSYYAGEDLTTIARACNSRGYRTRRGNPFDLRAVKLVLSNSFYVGLVKWKDIVFQGTHECRESVTGIFAANQERLQRDFHPKGRRQVSSCSHWLSGLLTCSECGGSLGFNRSNDPRRRPDFFQCWKYTKGIHADSCSISRKKAEATVLQSLKLIIDTGEVEFTYTQPANKASDNKLELLTTALERLATKELRIREAYEGGIDTLEEFKQNKLRLQKERDQIMAELKEFEQTPPTDPGAGKEELLKNIRTVYDLLQSENVSHEVKGNALRKVLQKAEYDGKTKTMRFYYYV
ncbi:MAG: recombinase zinc beta ribbon domain-containing protein, partial [Lachnospiraceae bacterium]|nr:recombinase zinc beta ribbon domain-containing protein [Lachnospiraceae bacterium]